MFPLALAYLNCAPQPEQVPIVEISGRSVTIVEKETKRVARPLKDDPEKAAGFIVTTLEEKLAKYPKASVVYGDIYFKELYNNSHYSIRYTFNPKPFCSSYKQKKHLLNKNLIITLHELKGSFSSKDYTSTTVTLGSQVYPMNMISTTHSGYHLPLEKTYYTPFPEAKKLYKALLLYVAHELPSIEKIYDHQNSIEVTQIYKTINSEEENIIKSHKLVLEKVKQVQPLSENMLFVQPCKL